MGTVFIDFKLKMRVSVCSLPVLSTALILLLQVHQDMATFPAVPAVPAIPAIGAAGAAGGIVLTGPMVAGLAALAVLTKLSVVATGVLVSRVLNRGGRGPARGKRSLESLELELELDVTLNMLVEMESEHCYKRIICAANTGKYYNQKLDGVMSLINEKASDLRASKFLAAAQYGAIVKDVAKCQHRYQCSMDLEFIQTVF